MIDFNIRRGLSSVLFSEPGVVNPRLVIEEGCWYLCTDTAELFLGVSTKDGLALKRINDSAKNPADEPTTGEGELVGGIIGAYINDTGELVVLFADGTEESLGVVVGANGQDGQDGKDGLTTAVQVNGVVYNHENGIITLPDFITEHQDLSEYAKKTDIPEAEIYKVDFNAPDFAAAIKAYNSGKLLLLVNAEPDVNSYAVMNYVREDKITFTKFLMSRSETYGAFNTYYLSPDNTWEVSKEVKLNKVEITDDGDLQIGKELYKTPSIEGLATEEFVNKKIAEVADQDVDLGAYYTKSEVDTKLLDIKANDVPFPNAKFVAKAFGGFAVGDNLEGLTVAQLFAKLLELPDEEPGENPEEPEVPTEPEGVVEEIIANKLPMYSVNADNEIIAGSYDDVIIYTEATAQEEPTEFGFYQITNEAGEVVESGYQELTADNPNVPYIIALPKDVNFNTMVTTQTYNELEGKWTNDSLEMSNDYSTISGLCEALSIDISHIDTEKFTLWADLSSGQGPSGKIHRFIINE